MKCFDSARQSPIEGFRSERGSSSPCGKGDEKDRLDKVAASQKALGYFLIAPKLEILNDRAAMLRKARQFFADRGVLEVDCGALVRSAPIDANIDVVSASVSETQTGYLHTSPEYAMKGLLSEGIGDIYFLGHVYRKGEIGRLHQPEFTMAEWYRLGISFSEMIEETCQFLFLFFGPLPTSKIGYREAFERFVGIDYSRASIGELQETAKRHSLHFSESWTRTNYLHLFLTHLIEPNLGQNELTILTDYPPYEAALAQVIEKNGEKVAERFEIYYKGVELTNGYHELGNAQELRERFVQENLEREAQGKEAYGLDEAFLSAMEKTFPQCCGVSVGFDRALMLRHNLPSIRDALPSCCWN